MPLPCQPAVRIWPLVATQWTQIRLRSRYYPRVGLALLLVLLILTGRGRAASSQPVTRYASRIVETKSGQIRGILQVCVSILLARERFYFGIGRGWWREAGRGGGEWQWDVGEEGGGDVSSDELPRQDLGILQVKRTRSRARSDTDSARCKWRIVIRGTSLFPRGKRRDLLPDWPCGEVGNFSSVRHRSRRSIIDYSWQRVIFFIILKFEFFT